MYELNQVSERSYYINCPSKIGVYRVNEQDVYLIDSGNDKEAGRKIRKILEENGWKLKGIINTHSHADHIGGNRYLQQQTGCKVFAGGIEASFTKATILEPAFLYGGYPCKALRHKSLMPQSCEVLELTDATFPNGLEIIPLPGHCFEMVGIRTPDNIVFLADCVGGKTILDKYQIWLIYDVAAFLETLDQVEQMEADMFVPAHADAAVDVKELVQYNRSKVFQIADKLLEICRKPICFEEILKQIFDEYDLNMNFEQYVLIGSTIRSYLSWLLDNGRMGSSFEENRLLWKTVV